MPAVFFDRDGVVNVERGHIASEDDVEVYAGVAEALKLLKSAGYLCVVVTNQPVVARGECSMDDTTEDPWKDRHATRAQRCLL